MIIYGRNPVLDAIEEGKSFEKIFVKDSLTGDFEKEIRKRCAELNIALKKVPQAKLDRLSRRANHQGVVAIGSVVAYQSIDMIVPHLYEQGLSPLFVLLDNVQDVRNIGAIARSVEALGGQALMLSGNQTGMITSDSMKSSAGALSRLMVCKEKNTIKTIQALQAHGINVIGTALVGGEDISSIDMTGPMCICMGSEGGGLHKTVLQVCDFIGRIPQTATGIMLYEAHRQKH